jgi:nucleoside-diphosphate-sugar epimerase
MRAGVTLVTGASGFLGGHLCRALASEGERVRGLVRRGPPPPGLESHVVADLFDRSAVRTALSGVDSVIHLAARVHVMGKTPAEAIQQYRRVNVEGTRALVEAAITAGVGRIVLTSSVKAVGEASDVSWTEATPPLPRDPYGVSKLEAERVLFELARPAGLHATVLRLPLVYGPGMRANMLRLFDLVDRGVPLPLGSVRNRRSVVFVGNVVAAIRCVLASPPAAGEVFFVRDEQELSTPELVRAIAAALGRPALLAPVPPPLFQLAGRVGDLLHLPLDSGVVGRVMGSLSVDASKLTRLTGFRPPVSLEDGLRETAAWYRGRRSHS